MDLSTQITYFISAVIPLYFIAFILYFVRILRGPTIPDIVIAIDALGYDLAVFLAVLAILFKSPLLIPCPIVLALWIYALDIYVAKYLEAREIGA
ncbi:MAG TPA: pH regulation protein F [Ignisphaera aggregans]|uniref:pH regulation protein F n=1 Tax=Ignisphaera aggregans TaxID=334771 RepID=A0A833DV33_9CREN|nr:pH regulation protein F [Ignisphaera aggregans]